MSCGGSASTARGIVLLIAINLGFSFYYHSAIAWQDHIGGLITGALLTAAFAYAPRKNRLVVQAGAAIAILAVLVVITVLRLQPSHRRDPGSGPSVSARWH